MTHSWPHSPEAAIALQQQLRNQVRIQPLDRPAETIAGCDISFNKFEEIVYAGIVVLRLDTLETIAEATAITTTSFPYIPGLLSFREIPALLEAWAKLTILPDVVVFDGHGIAHPRRLGIASHAGLLLDRPTLGCGKSVLVGRYEEPAPERGAWSPMLHRGEVIGAALRTKNKVNPVYVSPGHLIDLQTSIDLMLRCDGGRRGFGYRIPETTRRAHNLVNTIRRAALNP